MFRLKIKSQVETLSGNDEEAGLEESILIDFPPHLLSDEVDAERRLLECGYQCIGVASTCIFTRYQSSLR